MTDAGNTRPEPPRQDLTSLPSSRERTWATFCHLAAFTVLLRIPLGLIAGPLVVWLIKKNESAFVNAHGKAALNFQLSMIVYGIGAAVIGSWLLPVMFGVLWRHGIHVRIHGGLIHLGTIPGLCYVALWFPLLAVIVVLDVVCTIIAAVRANAGRLYRYPFTIPFIR